MPRIGHQTLKGYGHLSNNRKIQDRSVCIGNNRDFTTVICFYFSEIIININISQFAFSAVGCEEGRESVNGTWMIINPSSLGFIAFPVSSVILSSVHVIECCWRRVSICRLLLLESLINCKTNGTRRPSDCSLGRRESVNFETFYNLNEGFENGGQ